MKTVTTLFEQADHRWRIVARDPMKKPHLVDTNELVIESAGEALMTDPGGQEIFPAVFSALSAQLDPRSVTSIFASHPDPDAISALPLWLAFNPKIRCYSSGLWRSLIPHLGGGDADTLIALPDEGGVISLGDITLHALPAHHLHAAGNFHLYDPIARILFTGDVGAAILPATAGLFVEDFGAHIAHAEALHRRLMGSNPAKNAWCDRISQLQIDMLCPQHGAIYRGQDIPRFLDWFRALRVGL